MVQEKVKLIVIAGPTAVGKSAMGVSLALKFGGEVVSADSMQIYRGMDIGTGKITPSEACGVPHHMIDVVEPSEDYSVGRFTIEAAQAINDITSRGKVPILVGGTGLYINSLLFGHSFSGAPKDENVRSELKAYYEREGGEKLFARLKAVDPISANQINPNDIKRVIRALEIYELTGLPRSAQGDELEPRYDHLFIVLDDDREALYRRIDNRVDKMFELGLVAEVEGLMRYRSCNSMQAIGYKETVEYLEGNMALDQTIALIKQSSRRYAKRQMTFLRGIKTEKQYFHYDSDEIPGVIEQFLAK